MAESAKAKTDIEAITEDIAALKRDLAALVAHVKTGAVAGAPETAGPLRDEAKDIYERFAAGGGEFAEMISRQGEEQPLLNPLGPLPPRLLRRPLLPPDGGS